MTARLGHLAVVGPRPHRYLARLRVRVRRDSLDRRLAAGEDPRTDPDLALRAEELTEGDARRRIAMALYRLIDEASGVPAPFSSKVPLARGAIIACTPLLCLIAGRLESNQPVAARGAAQAALLLHEGNSPLYSTTVTDAALNRRLTEIAAALGVAPSTNGNGFPA
jgi:hypothetical protein